MASVRFGDGHGGAGGAGVLLAAGGTFGGVLFRPAGLQAPWSVHAGFGLQLAGLDPCGAQSGSLRGRR